MKQINMTYMIYDLEDLCLIHMIHVFCFMIDLIEAIT